MLVTFEVSRHARSREAREEQPENIPDVLVAFEVSNEDRSSSASFEQP